MVGLHANTLERIVQLRELKKKKMHNPGQRDADGGERGRGRERDEGKAHTKKKRSEIEALRDKNAGRREKKHD